MIGQSVVPTWNNYGSGGTALKPTSDGGMRTTLNGMAGAFGVYHRYGTDQYFEPPYQFTFDLNVLARKEPYTFEWGGTAGYDPAIVIHPLHGMSRTVESANAENIVMKFGHRGSDKASVSAEIDGRYGFRTGFVSRYKGDNFDPVGKGWMRVKVLVHSHAHYVLYIDDIKVIELTEQAPTTMSGPVGIGLRLDFFDAQIKNFIVSPIGGPVSNVLDHSRTDWYGADGPVTNNDGSLRRRITPVSEVVIHYGGAGTSWTDLGDSAQEIRNLQVYAAGAKKTWEYNIVVDSAAETWEYAGEFQAAHNGSGNADGDFGNGTSLGILCLYGLEPIAGTTIADRFVEGVRKALRQAIAAGWLNPVHTIKRHGDVRLLGTSCPGPVGQPPYWGRLTAPLEVAPVPIPDTPSEEDIMKPFYWKHKDHPELFVMPSGLHINGEIRDSMDYMNGGKLFRITSADNEQYARLMRINS